ncbi:MAG: PAS domain S-box protein [Planctomycetaceae bacterium]|nr:PAS domain S-box protein [Planctomycetaceae bacterium]
MATIVDPIITINEQGIIERFNKAAEKTFGYSAEEAIGQLITILIPAPFAQQHDESLKRYLLTGEKRIIGRGREAIALRKNGEMFPVDLAVSEVSLGARRLFTGIVRDITERKRHEAELEQAKAAADIASLTKGEFLANMSHEIRTPMTAILGYLDLIVDDVDDRDTVLEHVSVIRRNADHLLRVLNDILDLSKIEAGKVTADIARCSPIEIVEDVQKLFAARATEKHLTLKIEYQTPVPQWIYTDATRLRQVLMNLLGNALKFTDQGGVTIAVSLLPAGSHNSPKLQITVRDTGIGISPSDLERVFDPFTQADMTMRRRFGGTGLGLTISRRIAHLLGGDLTASSKSGQGSAFEVTIAAGPIDDVLLIHPYDGATKVAARNTTPPKSSADLKGLRILLAEDCLDSQRLVAFLLRKAGAEVVVVDNGMLAFEAATIARDRQKSFDVILMDMHMPVKDGYTATAELRRVAYTGPVIALTAHAMTGDRERCLAAGCDDYLTKPVDKARLIAACREWAESSRRAAGAAVAICGDCVVAGTN